MDMMVMPRSRSMSRLSMARSPPSSLLMSRSALHGKRPAFSDCEVRSVFGGLVVALAASVSGTCGRQRRCVGRGLLVEKLVDEGGLAVVDLRRGKLRHE